MGILGPLLAAQSQSNASRDASQAAAETSAAAVAEQRRQFDLSRADQLPWLQSGQAALGRLDKTAAGDMSQFYASPDYNFRRSEGTRDIGSSFAARGGAASGNALKALSEFNSNLAKSEFGDWWNRTAGQAGVGQATASGLGTLGQNSANTISSIYGNLGNTYANNIIAAGNARASGISKSAQGAENTFGYFFGGGG